MLVDWYIWDVLGVPFFEKHPNAAPNLMISPWLPHFNEEKQWMFSHGRSMSPSRMYVWRVVNSYLSVILCTSLRWFHWSKWPTYLAYQGPIISDTLQHSQLRVSWWLIDGKWPTQSITLGSSKLLALSVPFGMTSATTQIITPTKYRCGISPVYVYYNCWPCFRLYPTIIPDISTLRPMISDLHLATTLASTQTPPQRHHPAATVRGNNQVCSDIMQRKAEHKSRNKCLSLPKLGNAWPCHWWRWMVQWWLSNG